MKKLCLYIFFLSIPIFLCGAKKGPPDDFQFFGGEQHLPTLLYVLGHRSEVEVARPHALDYVYWVYPKGILNRAQINYVSRTEITLNVILPREFSGGGLFTKDGKLVAVYRAADGMQSMGVVNSVAERADRNLSKNQKGR